MKLKIPQSKPVSELLDERIHNASIAGRYRKLRTAFNELLELCYGTNQRFAYARKEDMETKSWFKITTTNTTVGTVED